MVRRVSSVLAAAVMFALAASPVSADITRTAGGDPLRTGSGLPQGNGQSGAHVIHCKNIPGGEEGVFVHVVATNEHHGGCDSPP